MHFTSSDAAATLPADATLVNGGGTFSATLTTAGNQTITVTDTVTSSVTGVSDLIAVGALAQTIGNFTATPAHPIFVPGGTFAVSATGGASANPVTFSIAVASAAICSAGGLNGATITMLASGTCTVLADQAGNASYAQAPEATLAVTLGSAIIKIPALSDWMLGLLGALLGSLAFARARRPHN